MPGEDPRSRAGALLAIGGQCAGYVLGGWVANSGIGDWGATVLGAKAESWRWAFYLVVPPGILLGLWAFSCATRRAGKRTMLTQHAQLVCGGGTI
jgi:hypothetical protein